MNENDYLMPDQRWFNAPHERTPEFFRTFSQVSIAVQESLRQLAPQAFFADLAQFAHDRGAYAMLAYAASRPYRPKTRTDFTYDLTNATVMTTFYSFSKRKFIAGLVEAQARLTAAGQEGLAKLYDPRNVKAIMNAVNKRKRFRKPLHRFLVAEGKLVNELTAFSGLDECSPKEQAKQANLILDRWRSTLQHLCLGVDLSALTEPLFEKATEAYLNASQPETAKEPGEPFDLLDLAA